MQQCDQWKKTFDFADSTERNPASYASGLSYSN